MLVERKSNMQQIDDPSDGVVVDSSDALGVGCLLRKKLRVYLKNFSLKAEDKPVHLSRHILQEVERALLEEVMTVTDRNQSLAAEMLGWHRNTLSRRLKALGLFRTVKKNKAQRTA